MTTDRPNGSLYTKIENRIATLAFGHPSSNSFPGELLQRLTNEINTLSKNPEVSLILLKSEGEGAFCAGASFDELLQIDNLTDGKQLSFLIAPLSGSLFLFNIGKPFSFSGTKMMAAVLLSLCIWILYYFS